MTVSRFPLSAMLALICTLLIHAASSAQQLTVVQEKAPMFKNPSISSPIIKYLEKNSKVNMLAAEDSFYLVSYGGYEGWVIPYSVKGEKPQENTATQPSPSHNAEIIDSGRYLVVINEYANVREGPGLDYKRIGKVYKGDLLEKFIKRGDWYRVKLPDNRIAFIYEKLVAEPTPSSSQTLALPAAEVTGSLEERIARLEREVQSLRKTLRETQASLMEMQRTGGALPQSIGKLLGGKLLDGNSLFTGNAPALNSGEGASVRIIANKATRVYHLPGSIFYDKIPEELREIFRSEDQARKAGYTKSIN